MKMTEQEFRNECVYTVTMLRVKSMLECGLISEEEYWKINNKMKEKYQPVSDGLVSENSMRCDHTNLSLLDSKMDIKAS